MRNNLIRSVAFVDRGLENLHALPRNFRAPPPDQLLALPRKHWTDHNFDPTHIAFDDIHKASPGEIPALADTNLFSSIIAQRTLHGTSSRYKKGQRPRRRPREMPPCG